METFIYILNKLPEEMVHEIYKFLPRCYVPSNFFEIEYFKNDWNKIHQITKSSTTLDRMQGIIIENIQVEEDSYLVQEIDKRYSSDNFESITIISKYENTKLLSKIEYKKHFDKFLSIIYSYDNTDIYIIFDITDDFIKSKINRISKTVYEVDYKYSCCYTYCLVSETLDNIYTQHHFKHGYFEYIDYFLKTFKEFNIKYIHEKKYEIINKKNHNFFNYGVRYFFHDNKKIIITETFLFYINDIFYLSTYIYVNNKKICIAYKKIS